MQKGTIVASKPTAANTLWQSEDSEAGTSDLAWCFPDRALGSAWYMCYYLESLGEPLWEKVEAAPSQAGQSAPTPACWGSLQGVACGSSWCHAGPREVGLRETEGPLGGDAGLAPRSQLALLSSRSGFPRSPQNMGAQRLMQVSTGTSLEGAEGTSGKSQKENSGS